MNSSEFFQSIRGGKVLVVGDYVVDHYRFLTPKNLSPEAPIVCFSPKNEEFRHGGAGNVVNNLISIGMAPYFLTSVGKDLSPIPMPGDCLLIVDDKRMTTTKERLLTARQQIARIDKQSSKRISSATASKMLSIFFQNFTDCIGIVFSDYDHGSMSHELVLPIMDFAMKHGIPTVIDSKAPDTVHKYRGCTIAIPNIDEAIRILASEDAREVVGPSYGSEKVETIASNLRACLKSNAVAVTMGPDGVYLDSDLFKERFEALRSEHEVVDVTGAGDTVAAMVVAGLVARLPFDSIMMLANIAAGIKVQKLGVASVTPDEINRVVGGLHG